MCHEGIVPSHPAFNLLNSPGDVDVEGDGDGDDDGDDDGDNDGDGDGDDIFFTLQLAHVIAIGKQRG